jgi:glycosyltransferase involved in cell wall biosynthesis
VKVYVHGFPGLYGGAQTELHHQIPIWQRLGFEVHLIPSMPGFEKDPLLPELVRSGIIVHAQDQFEVIEKNAPVFGFCSRNFLRCLDLIRHHSTNTVFVNCMTWLFEEEKRRQAEGKIKTFLYQNEDVRRIHAPQLRTINRSAGSKFFTFVPYFDTSKFPYIEKRASEFFGIGRISRQDQDKFAPWTVAVYENIASPRPKVGLFLGFDERSEKKVGKPPPWIITARDQNHVSQQQFYAFADSVIQCTDTVENWPRIGLEAMASGSVLVVDNRGGWQRMVEHGKTGFLCNGPQDFVFYGSKLAYEPDTRDAMARAALERGKQLAGEEVSKASWKEVFEFII